MTNGHSMLVPVYHKISAISPLFISILMGYRTVYIYLIKIYLLMFCDLWMAYFFLIKWETACFFSWIIISLEAVNHDFPKNYLWNEKVFNSSWTMFLVVSYIFWKVISSVVRNVTRHYIIIPLHVLAQIFFLLCTDQEADGW